jgi:DNA-directed RNA polymerase subunit RPC12/RpoP
MAEKTLGYIELEWTCKRCGTKNPGTEKTCANCGAAMADQDQFDLPAQQQLITDPEKLAQAEKGPDVHCGYCGTRNPAGAEVCSQCGADLKDAQARGKGQVLGAYSTQAAPDIICPSCGTANPASASRCVSCAGSLAAERQPSLPPATAASQKPSAPNKMLLIGAVAALAVICLGVILFFFFAARTDAQSAVVQSVRWERNIEILEQQPVERQDWQDQIPAGAQMGACRLEYRYTQLEPAPGAEEVCGTPYTVDEGSGVARVVQDCEYRVYDDWCDYTQMEWVVVETSTAQGNDMNPLWPAVSLEAGQQEGDRDESYIIAFQSEGETYTYRISDPGEFSQFMPGSEWTLEVNTFGAINAVREK